MVLQKSDEQILSDVIWDLHQRQNNKERGIFRINVDASILAAARLKYLQAQREVPPEHANKIGHTLDKLGNFLREALGPIWDNPEQYNDARE